MAKQTASKQVQKPATKPVGTTVTEAPIEKSFFLNDGRILRTLKDLKDALETMDDSTFYHHVTADRNDFANWVRDVFNQPELADKIAKAETQFAVKRAISLFNK